ncbi:MAG: DUF3810 domain-containing protein [Oscillospiraceae bacterium]|nr:DUF3810 domain-containing protein [Oscillospiraceae bacterium]
MKKALTYLFLILPAAALAAGFYVLRGNIAVMDFAAERVSAPARAALGLATGLLRRVSLYEVIASLLVLFVAYFLIKTVVLLFIRGEKLATLTRRVLALVIAAAYLGGAFLWLWCVNYYATPFYAGSGVSAEGVTLDALRGAAFVFADGANRYSDQVRRGEDGSFAEELDDILTYSVWVYDGLEQQFPRLSAPSNRPKPMLYSKLMSTFGYTGTYMALTGEANLNADAPRCLIPATAAHELAHAHGVGAEQEANFAGIAACVTSDIPMFEYSGYLMGLISLSDALYGADRDAYGALWDSFDDNVRRDLLDNYEYWEEMESDSPAVAAVTAMYDGYLKSNGQELGVQSYGACVDLLVNWMEMTSADV